MLRILLIVWSSLRMRDFWVKDTYSPGVPWKLEVVVSHPRDQIRCQVHLLQMNWSFYYFCFSWSIIALQCVLVSVVQKSGSAIGMPASPPAVSSLPPFRSAWRTRLSFLRPPAPSHWLFHTHQGYSPAHSNPPMCTSPLSMPASLFLPWKIGSAPLIIRETQIKTAMRYLSPYTSQNRHCQKNLLRKMRHTHTQ